MKNKQKASRKAYTAQFYQKNRGTLLITVVTTLLIASINL